MRVFVRVVEAGTFTKAADSMLLPGVCRVPAQPTPEREGPRFRGLGR